MNMIQKVQLLREKTGASLLLCKRALEYTEKHKDCTPEGYIKSKNIAVNTKNMSFYERVKFFS